LIEVHRRANREEIEVEYEDCPPELMKARAYALNAKHGLPVDNKVRDQIIVELRQGVNGLDPMTPENIAEALAISTQRVYQILKEIKGPLNFISDKAKVAEGTRQKKHRQGALPMF